MKYDGEKIKALNPLRERLIEHGVNIDNRGFARCPFHNEKTASFRVYEDESFYCFGCGAHGDVITFVMKIDGLSFPEACRKLDGNLSYSEQRKIIRKKHERVEKLSEEKQIQFDYWSAFDRFRVNENIISVLAPKNIDDEPCDAFLRALARRSRYEHELDMAEIAYVGANP